MRVAPPPEKSALELWRPVLLVVGVLVAFGGIALAGSSLLVLSAGPNQRIDWERPDPPTPAEIHREVATISPGPVFWFGPGDDALPLSAVGRSTDAGSGDDVLAVFFSYRLFCEQTSRGGSLQCEDGAEVSTADRSVLSLTTGRRACWVRAGLAWIIDCPGHGAEFQGPRLFTEGRVVRFAIGEGTRDRALRPWRETLGRLQRLGSSERGEAVLSPTARLSRAEFAALGPTARAAVPAELRPTR